MAAILERLRTMSREEFVWRLRTRVRTSADELSCTIRQPRWQREDIADALATETLSPGTQAAIRESDWSIVNRGLRQMLQCRPGRFILNPSAAAAVKREVLARWPAAGADALRRASSIRAGRFDLLGYRGVSFHSGPTGGIDWHFDPIHDRRMPVAFWSRIAYLDPSYGDHKVIWELNRQQHWLTLSRALWLTGDSCWAGAIVRDFTAWLAANPPLTGANWASMLELSFRSLSWLWGLHATLTATGSQRPASNSQVQGDQHRSGLGVGSWELGVDDDKNPWLVDLLVALDRQMTHVERNLSIYFSPNTHLTGEALALYVVGAAVPELASSARWIDVGRTVLMAEIARQIEEDGGHAERSTHYHRYTLDFYLHALLTARRIGDEEAALRFEAALHQVAPFALAMADCHGRLPLIGDDDGGRLWPVVGRDVADIRDSLSVAAAVLDRPELAPWGATEETLWLTTSDPEAFARALRMDVEERRVSDRRTLMFRPAGRRTALHVRGDVLPFPAQACRRGAERRRTGMQRGARTGAAADRAASNGDLRTTCVFAQTGYVTSSTGSGDHLVMDVGPHGYLNGGHAHADALSVTLALRGRPLLVDPGTPTYTMDRALRDQLRSSLTHNTLSLDGASSAVPNGPFHWLTRANGRLEHAARNPRFALVEATHDGYTAASHRRVVLATGSGYLIVDVVTGQGCHEAAQCWHLDPNWSVAGDGGRSLRLVHVSGDAAWLLHDRGTLSLIAADESSAMGWVSPAYGVRIPTWTARVTLTGDAPFALVTWCGPAAGEDAPVLERVCPDADASALAVAVSMRLGAAESLTLLRPGDAAARQRRCAVNGVSSDARMLRHAIAEDGATSICLADATCVLTPVLSLEADRFVPDLHLERIEERLELTASIPPPSLVLDGRTVRDVGHVRLNGRELSRGGTGHAITISAGEWGQLSSTTVSGSSRCAG